MSYSRATVLMTFTEVEMLSAETRLTGVRLAIFQDGRNNRTRTPADLIEEVFLLQCKAVKLLFNSLVPKCWTVDPRKRAQPKMNVKLTSG